MPGAQLCSRLAAKSGNVDRALNADWNAVQRPEGLPVQDGCFRLTRPLNRRFCANLNECVDLRINFLDASEVRFNNLDGRHIARSNMLGNFAS